jgi:hypothetical protein
MPIARQLMMIETLMSHVYLSINSPIPANGLKSSFMLHSTICEGGDQGAPVQTRTLFAKRMHSRTNLFTARANTLRFAMGFQQRGTLRGTL